MSNSRLPTLPPLPQSLKPISPFVLRADELQSTEPIIAYWCTYYAAQAGLDLKSSDAGAREYLLNLITRLEMMKGEIGAKEAIESEAVAAAYIENFALRVFASADNVDRKGLSNRTTAKKFLAAANFLELLSVFEKSNNAELNAEKIRYAKWKASDIARAIREGRKPTPGPAGDVDDGTTTRNDATEYSTGSLPPSQQDAMKSHLPLSGADTLTPEYQGQGARFSSEAAGDVSNLDTTVNLQPNPTEVDYPVDATKEWNIPTVPIIPPGQPNTVDNLGQSISNIDITSQNTPIGGQPLQTDPAILLYPRPGGVRFDPPSTGISSPGLPMALSPKDDSLPTVDTVFESNYSIPLTVDAPEVKPDVIHPESPPVLTDFNVNPGLGDISSPYAAIPPVLGGPTLEGNYLVQDYPSPSTPHESTFSGVGIQPSAPVFSNELGTGPVVNPRQHISAAPPKAIAQGYNFTQVHAPPPPPPLRPPGRVVTLTPVELTASVVTKAQKHCRFAISALEYEDAKQARKELKTALAILGERIE